MDDFFDPLDFTNFQGAPHNFLISVSLTLDEMPPFSDNNAFTAEAHIHYFNLRMSKCRPYSDYEDVKMRLFVLTLAGDAVEWFIDSPKNTFDSFQSLIEVFENEYGD